MGLPIVYQENVCFRREVGYSVDRGSEVGAAWGHPFERALLRPAQHLPILAIIRGSRLPSPHNGLSACLLDGQCGAIAAAEHTARLSTALLKRAFLFAPGASMRR
jgi:hypothetical protein